jgi:hypothetical protein
MDSEVNHTKVRKTVSCSICGQTFEGHYSKGNAGRHQRTVHRNLKDSPKPRCEICDKSFKRSDALIVHKARAHSLADGQPTAILLPINDHQNLDHSFDYPSTSASDTRPSGAYASDIAGAALPCSQGRVETFEGTSIIITPNEVSSDPLTHMLTLLSDMDRAARHRPLDRLGRIVSFLQNSM